VGFARFGGDSSVVGTDLPSGPGNPQLRRVTDQNVQQAIDQVKQFVDDNTR